MIRNIASKKEMAFALPQFWHQPSFFPHNKYHLPPDHPAMVSPFLPVMCVVLPPPFQYK